MNSPSSQSGEREFKKERMSEMSNKKNMKIICFTLLFSLLTSIVSFSITYAEPVSSLSDADFFGVWNGSSWTTVPKLNYAYSTQLAGVESAAKAGNYTLAGQELLNY